MVRMLLGLVLLLAPLANGARIAPDTAGISTSTISKHHDRVRCHHDKDCGKHEFCPVPAKHTDGLLTKKAKLYCSPTKPVGEACTRPAECDAHFCIQWSGKQQCQKGCNVDADCSSHKAPRCVRTMSSVPLGECVPCTKDSDCQSKKKKKPTKYCLPGGWGKATSAECVKFGASCTSFMDCSMGEICDSTANACRKMY